MPSVVPLLHDDDFVPVLATEVELSDQLPDIPATHTRDGTPFGRARVLVRIHTLPIGVVEIDVPASGIEATVVASEISRALGPATSRHLVADGEDPKEKLTAAGLTAPFEPGCLHQRRETLRSPPFVSVVVPTVDRPDALRLCLQDLIEQAYPSFEILVVDNAPDESGARMVVSSLDAGARSVKYLQEPRRGASRARNHGLSRADGDIVAFVDGDVRIDRWWLAAVATAMNQPTGGPGSGDVLPSCVTGAILPANLETPAQLWMEEWGGFAKGFERQIHDLREHRAASPMYPFAAMFGSGANMSFRTSELRRLGGFDTCLGGGTPSQGGEDLASFLDVLSSGGSLVYEPAAIVRHEHPRTEEQFRSRLRSYGVGLTSFLVRHASRRPTDAARIAAAVPAAMLYFFRSDSPKNRHRSRTYPRGTRRDEIRGMIRGPFAYAAGRAQRRGGRE